MKLFEIDVFLYFPSSPGIFEIRICPKSPRAALTAFSLMKYDSR